MPELTQMGVQAVFTPGTPIEEAVKWVRENIKPGGNCEMPKKRAEDVPVIGEGIIPEEDIPVLPPGA